MPLAVLLWLALLQLLAPPSLHSDGARYELGAPAASWRGAEAASPRSLAHPPGSLPSLRGAGTALACAALPAGTIAVPSAIVRTELRGTDGPRVDDLAPPSRTAGRRVRRVAGSDLSGRLASHAAEAHGGRLPYFPTAPPLHG